MLPVPFMKDVEIESRMETELERSGLWPPLPPAVFDIEAFLLQHLGVTLDKDAIFDGAVLGEVIFRANRRPRININADLTVQAEGADAVWQVGRWRMTLAHEAGHVILHGPFYLPQGQTSLWDDDEPKIHRCYKGDLGPLAQMDDADFARQHGWDSGRLINDSKQKQSMEIQANLAAAALLMPRKDFIPTAELLYDQARINFSSVTSRQNWVEHQLGNRYSVSRQAARIRCGQLGLLALAEQPRMELETGN